MKKGWLAYGVIISLFVVFGEVSNIHKGKEITAFTIVNWLFTVMILLSVFGYALQKRISNAVTWKVLFWFSLFVSLLMTSSLAFKTGASVLLVVVLMLPIILPAYVAMYRYAYSSSHIWGH